MYSVLYLTVGRVNKYHTIDKQKYVQYKMKNEHFKIVSFFP